MATLKYVWDFDKGLSQTIIFYLELYCGAIFKVMNVKSHRFDDARRMATNGHLYKMTRKAPNT